MHYKTREERLWEGFSYRLRLGARDNTDTPYNKRLIYRLSCNVWRWRQEYRAQYRIKEETYNSLLQTVRELEDQIQSGKYEAEARQAVEDACSWLESLLDHRVIRKNRVY